MKCLIFALLPISVWAADIKVPPEFLHGHFRLVARDSAPDCVEQGDLSIDNFGGGNVLEFNGRDLMGLKANDSFYDDLSTCHADVETRVQSEAAGSATIMMTTEYTRCKDRKKGSQKLDETLIWTVTPKTFRIQHLQISKSEATTETTCEYVRR